jgi:hypothetical protein
MVLDSRPRQSCISRKLKATLTTFDSRVTITKISNRRQRNFHWRNAFVPDDSRVKSSRYFAGVQNSQFCREHHLINTAIFGR